MALLDMFLSCLASLAASARTQGQSFNGRLTINADLTVIDCRWDAVSQSQSACCIICTSQATSILILTTTFANAWTTWTESKDYGSGGACDLRCSSVTISDCCAYDCSAFYYGQFMYMDGNSAIVERTTLVNCGRRAGLPNCGDEGGIEFGGGASADCRDLNFTDCKIWRDGAAITGRSGSSSLTIVRTTCLRCEARSIIHTGRSVLPTVSFCNFYGCGILAAKDAIWWVLTGLKNGNTEIAGLRVTNCIFNGNTANREIGVQNSNTKITIENCVFSGAFPSSSFITQIGTNNHESKTTDSHKLFAMNTHYCPAIHLATPSDSPVTTPTHTPTRTPQPTRDPGIDLLG
jgi:hypothetical protein